MWLAISILKELPKHAIVPKACRAKELIQVGFAVFIC
jgi:hypothetical protein